MYLCLLFIDEKAAVRSDKLIFSQSYPWLAEDSGLKPS